MAMNMRFFRYKNFLRPTLAQNFIKDFFWSILGSQYSDSTINTDRRKTDCFKMILKTKKKKKQFSKQTFKKEVILS